MWWKPAVWSGFMSFLPSELASIPRFCFNLKLLSSRARSGADSQPEGAGAHRLVGRGNRAPPGQSVRTDRRVGCAEARRKHDLVTPPLVGQQHGGEHVLL